MYYLYSSVSLREKNQREGKPGQVACGLAYGLTTVYEFDHSSTEKHNDKSGKSDLIYLDFVQTGKLIVFVGKDGKQRSLGRSQGRSDPFSALTLPEKACVVKAANDLPEEKRPAEIEGYEKDTDGKFMLKAPTTPVPQSLHQRLANNYFIK